MCAICPQYYFEGVDKIYGRDMDQKYVDILEEHVAELGENQDLLSTIGDLNQKLKGSGWPNKAEDLITDVFYAVLNDKADFEMGGMVEFLKVVPTGLKTRQMSDEDVIKLVPEQEWGYFRPDSWIRKNTRITPDETRSLR